MFLRFEIMVHEDREFKIIVREFRKMFVQLKMIVRDVWNNGSRSSKLLFASSKNGHSIQNN